MKYAAIDIGSNAVRLLFSTVQKNGRKIIVKKSDLIRVPVRLGGDVFSKGTISKKNEEKLLKAMTAFRNLIDIHAPEAYRACATSAMREAQNGAEIVKKIKKLANIKIEIVDGIEEAELICNNYSSQEQKGTVMFIDVGGGSTEISVFSGRSIKESQSFKLGTIRLLKNKEEISEWKRLKDFCGYIRAGYPDLAAIASGGNINKLVKLSGKSKKEISLKTLKEVYAELEAYSYEERISILGLKPDRADVIIPASQIFLAIMESTGLKKLHVPQIGLSDGIVIDLYQKSKQTH